MDGENGIDTIQDWSTLSEDTNLLSDEMALFLQANPVAYAGHRIIANFVQSGGLDGPSEYNEVPFLNRWFFAVALTGYWLVRRLLHLLGLSKPPSGFDGHVLVMHSTRHDKRHTLSEVGRTLSDRGEDVLLLCSPEAERYRTEWEAGGLDTTTFVELLGAIPARGWLSVVSETRRSVAGLRNHAPDSFGRTPTVIVFNFVFLEAVKAEALGQTTDSPTIHTYAPMGYVLAATAFERVFGYQHGIMYGTESDTGHQEFRRGYPFFAPINYFTWGEPWHEKYQYSTPPDTQLHPTGSPWHEYLSRYDDSGEPEYDVLFLSSSGRQTAAGEQAFEEYVRRLIDICKRRHWRLGIKLHPTETGDWYAERDWSEYVIGSNPEIQDALSDTRVAITTGSSTLVEALVLGTPICKWYHQQSPMERKRDFELIFEISLETIESTVESAMDVMEEQSDATSVLNCYGATDRIVEATTGSEPASATAGR